MRTKLSALSNSRIKLLNYFDLIKHQIVKTLLVDAKCVIEIQLIMLKQNFAGNHEDKINRIVKLEDQIAELLNAAQKQKEEYAAEISKLKEQLKNAENTSKVPSNELQSKEEAYRKTIAEADSLLSKMEADYQTTIKVCI